MSGATRALEELAALDDAIEGTVAILRIRARHDPADVFHFHQSNPTAGRPEAFAGRLGGGDGRRRPNENAP